VCPKEGKVQQSSTQAGAPEGTAKEGVSKGRSGESSKC